ncbi:MULTISPECIES: carboxylesterase [Aerococcus]|uniref:alpha/beta hydrolase n=1 Tax=Aerococcus TaxID=1375 RepID=UPI0008BC83B6|nr:MULTISPECIES: alpha/beta fold hydrolase [Aerococcus]MDK6368773.1 alpha/beta fold hydrolase [Aerococcus sp. UMB9870]MDK6679321.1 alpha/beta fold hydrolase [Aerococcus sp. UMB8608]MDK6685837.1 alpha/beta fold hydrolase [Aerococcus sp. UMB8623]MDK6939396.1 alpha/beta fold hydrolase [Aerococcus sp. UMB8487]OFK19341.1 hypothetical protein HMPREF2829_00920 [Aerococcus sp. HMSC072A12]
MKLPGPFYFKAGPRAVLLLHAYTGTANDQRMLGRRLNRENYTVLGPNFTGHATTDVDQLVETPTAQWIEDGRQALAQLRADGYEEIAVFGLSLGSSIASRLLLDDDALLGGGVFSSPLMLDSIRDSQVPQAFIEYVKKVGQLLGKSPEEIAAKVQAIQPKLDRRLEDMDQMNGQICQDLAGLDKPYFIAQGEKDELIDGTAGSQLKAYLEDLGKHVDFVSYPEAGHVLTVGSNHKYLEDDVLKFLEGLDWKDKA